MTLFFTYKAYTRFDATEEDLEMLRKETMPERVKEMVANGSEPCEWEYHVFNTDYCCPRCDGDEDIDFVYGN